MIDNPDAPRVTPEMVDLEISRELYHVPEGTTLTICTLELQNGFTVTGESAYADPASFNIEEGQQRAKTKAREKVFLLLAFRLRDEAHSQETRRNEAREKLHGSKAAESDPLLRAALESPQDYAKRFLSDRCAIDGKDSTFTASHVAVTAFREWLALNTGNAWSEHLARKALLLVDHIDGKPIRYVKLQNTGWTGFKLKASK
ncbi:Gp49 family protein [Cribrihabitans pelagius]|uniref:Gp49 family protein n=1 Tax=Cribrihabitans pelagius TaxID=1765746 RepID=UPI003B5A5768